MKISHQQLMDLVTEELNKIDQETLDEGVMDYLKGAGQSAGNKAADTGRSIAKAFGDKATAAKNKVGQVAGDIKNAGAQASLRGDIQKAVQQSGQVMERFKRTFTDLLARAQSMRLDDEEQQIKAELQAIENYQGTAGSIDADYSGVADDVMDQRPATKQEPFEVPANVDLPPLPQQKKTSSSPAPVDLTHSDMHGREKSGAWPSGTEQWGNEPLDWRAKKPKKVSKPNQTKITPTSTKAPKPKIKTKLDRDSVKNAVKAAGGDYGAAAKKLGVSKEAMIQALAT